MTVSYSPAAGSAELRSMAAVTHHASPSLITLTRQKLALMLVGVGMLATVAWAATLGWAMGVLLRLW